MDYFQQQISINLNSLFFIALVLLILVILAIVFFHFKNRKLNMENQNKTSSGFLGKTLYALLGLFVVGAGLVFAVLALNQQEVFNIQAKRTVTAEIYTQVLLVDGDHSYVDFKITPSVEGVVWGETGSEFQIYWSFVKMDDSSVNYSFIEKAKDINNRSGLQEYFEKGSYSLNATILYEDESYTFTKVVDF